MNDTGEEELRELFSQLGFVVRDIDIDEEENLASVYIEIVPTETYTVFSIENIIKKVKKLQDELTKEGLVEDIKMGDIHKGNWRIVVYFKSEE